MVLPTVSGLTILSRLQLLSSGAPPRRQLQTPAVRLPPEEIRPPDATQRGAGAPGRQPTGGPAAGAGAVRRWRTGASASRR